MFMQNVMLLAVERGLGTCPQEYWARYPKTVAKFLDLPDDHMLFAGMALGYSDASHPINSLKASRDAFEVWGELRGFG
jgi:nitroreductase